MGHYCHVSLLPFHGGGSGRRCLANVGFVHERTDACGERVRGGPNPGWAHESRRGSLPLPPRFPAAQADAPPALSPPARGVWGGGARGAGRWQMKGAASAAQKSAAGRERRGRLIGHRPAGRAGSRRRRRRPRPGRRARPFPRSAWAGGVLGPAWPRGPPPRRPGCN